MGGRGASSGGVTDGFSNRVLRQNNPYMFMSKSRITAQKAEIGRNITDLDRKMKTAQSIVATSTSKSLVAKQKAVLTNGRKRMEKLNLDYARASYAEKHAKNNVPF